LAMKEKAAGLLLLSFILFASSYSQGQERLLYPGQLYDSSMELYYEGRCEEAIEGFSKIVRSAPASKLVSYSQYMIGLCHLKAGRYEEAIQQLELYLRIYPEGNRVREVEKGIQGAKEQLKEKYLETATASGLRRKSRDEGRKVKRRICVQVSTFEGKSLEELEKRVMELKNAGVNTIIIRDFKNKGERD